MPTPPPEGPHQADLRVRAEARLTLAMAPAVEPALADALKLVHELQVHQVELQLQQAELERTQAELKAALNRQLWLFDQAPVGYCSLDADGVVREANAMACTLLQQPCESLPGQRLGTFFTALGTQTVDALLRHVAAWPVPHTAEAPLRGDPPVLLELLARSDPAGHGTVVALLDATARRRAEDQRRRAEVAERINQGRAIFLSELNHELRTPLNAVLGLSNLILRSRDSLNDQHRQWIQQIETSGQHLLALSCDALDLARIDAGRIDLALEPVDVQAAVAEALAMVAEAARTHRVTLALLPGAPGRAAADLQRLRQVLLNLLTNAIKYNNDGGTVTVTVLPQPGSLSVQVQDNGRGMDAQQLQRLFEPFQRLGAERSRIQGTGLGLVLSRRLAEAMGGTLSLASAPGAGTTATLVLPSAD